MRIVCKHSFAPRPDGATLVLVPDGCHQASAERSTLPHHVAAAHTLAQRKMPKVAPDGVGAA